MGTRKIVEGLKTGAILAVILALIIVAPVLSISIYMAVVFFLFWMWSKFWIVLLIFMCGSTILIALDLWRDKKKESSK